MSKRFLTYLAIFLLVFSLVIVGCTKQDAEPNQEGGQQGEAKEVELAYAEWGTEVAAVNVVKAVLQEKMGYDVEITPVSASAMYSGVAASDVDGMVSAWLPTTHGHYLDEVKEDVEDLGVNLDGTKIGLVVPKYVTINSIDEMEANAEKFDNKIIGIEPGAGIMSKTEQVIEEYGLDNFEIMEGTGATMTAALGDAIKNEEWVAVTGWTPHWKFGRWDLKYLDDPKGIYGGAEQIHTLVRKGLKEDMPEVYNLLDNFNWTPSDMEELMVWNQEEGADPYENAKRWIAENEDKVNEWMK